MPELSAEDAEAAVHVLFAEKADARRRASELDFSMFGNPEGNAVRAAELRHRADALTRVAAYLEAKAKEGK